METPRGSTEQEADIVGRHALLAATLCRPDGARGIIAFAHGSGSSRFSPRNRSVARRLNTAGFATVLADLLTPEEERADRLTGHRRFDIGFLAIQFGAVADWLVAQPPLRDLPCGYFGASTGAGAALVAATARPACVRALVSRGGRPDLAGAALPQVAAPTLLIVGSRDVEMLALNQAALDRMACVRKLAVVPGAAPLFDLPGTLNAAAAPVQDRLVRAVPARRWVPRSTP